MGLMESLAAGGLFRSPVGSTPWLSHLGLNPGESSWSGEGDPKSAAAGQVS